MMERTGQTRCLILCFEHHRCRICERPISMARRISLALIGLLAAAEITSAQIEVPQTTPTNPTIARTATISFEEPARVGGPVWVHLAGPEPYGAHYPVGIVPGDFGCHEFEVRCNGELLPRRGPDATVGPPPSGPPCGYVGSPGVTMTHPGRLPLHLQYKFDSPGRY